MNDNPFGEAGDNDRTIIRPPSRRAAAAIDRPPFSPFASSPSGYGEADAIPKVGTVPMTAAAAPLLDLLARIGTGAASVGVADAETLRLKAIDAVKVFETECRAAGISMEETRAAHYTLCAALDDVALSAPWSVDSHWRTHSLSSTFHQDVRFGEHVFDLLATMQKEPGRYRQALELAYLCLALGLRGRYRLEARGNAELERIREGIHQLLVQLRGPRDRELSLHWRGVDAPNRGVGRYVPVWVAGVVALALLCFAYLFVSLHVNAASDALQDKLAALPPSAAPTIQRSAPPAPVQLPPDDLVTAFQKFLDPEIREQLVTVEGDAQRVMVRIRGSGMFQSGRADLNPRFVTVVQRVGDALRDHPGKVVVRGHSDNQPIHTVEFPSNYDLSAARARKAKELLATRTGDASRFSSIGLAADDQLASNATAQGQEENRRIEVVLSRAEDASR